MTNLSVSAPLMYRAHLNVDYTGQNGQAYQDLQAAIIQAGWSYVETSAFVIETEDIAAVWRGIELVAKQSANAGTLSALTFHVQGSQDFSGIPNPSGKFRPNAMQNILNLPFPTPQE